MPHPELEMSVGDFLVGVTIGQADGQSFIALHGIDCNLEGEEPGLYFPTPLDEEQ